MKGHYFKYELGLEAKDKITGFKGIITCRKHYVTGCDTYDLTCQEVQEGGKLGDIYGFDEGRIEIIGDGITEKEVKADRGKGGPAQESVSYR